MNEINEGIILKSYIRIYSDTKQIIKAHYPIKYNKTALIRGKIFFVPSSTDILIGNVGDFLVCFKILNNFNSDVGLFLNGKYVECECSVFPDKKMYMKTLNIKNEDLLQISNMLVATIQIKNISDSDIVVNENSTFTCIEIKEL